MSSQEAKPHPQASEQEHKPAPRLLVQIVSISIHPLAPDHPCVVCKCWDVTDPGSLLCPKCHAFDPKSHFTLP